jgi:hypothetical protein
LITGVVVHAQATILSPPAVVGLLADGQLAAQRAGFLALGQLDLSLAQFGHDLLWTETLFWHLPTSSLPRILTLQPDRFKGGRSPSSPFESTPVVEK